MTEQEKKNELIAYFKELGFSYSLDFEKDVNGTMHVDIHSAFLDQILSAGKAYISLTTIEITIKYVYTQKNFNAVKQAVKTLRDEFIITTNDMAENIGTIVMKGQKAY